MWKINLVIFGALVVVTLVYALWQMRAARHTFFRNVEEHAAHLARVVELSVRTAVVSREISTRVVSTFLENTARFVDFLDAVEPFTDEELTEFSLESGLAGIAVSRSNAEQNTGPKQSVQPPDPDCEDESAGFVYNPDTHLFILTRGRTQGPGCIRLAMPASAVEALLEQVSRKRVLVELSRMPGILSVHIEPVPPGTAFHRTSPPLDETPPRVRLIRRERSAAAHIPFQNGMLIVKTDARRFFDRIDALWKAFSLFAALLTLLGGGLSFVLFRFQETALARERNLERQLARRREEAALGRATTAIAHEIRNPLNAIAIGLQRLQLEAENLTGTEAKTMIDTMRRAIGRTDGIVANLRQYARPLEPVRKPVNPAALIDGVLALYEEEIRRRGIRVDRNDQLDRPVSGDPALLTQAVENLIKNALEAAPDGGGISIHTGARRESARLSFENDGYSDEPEPVGRLMEPYVTTKTRGTGLGLPIVNRIVKAHSGNFYIEIPAPGRFRAELTLPLTEERKDRP